VNDTIYKDLREFCAELKNTKEFKLNFIWKFLEGLSNL